MAKQTSLITFTGKLGNMIGYERKGQYLLRSKPETVRQTAATRRAAQRFGLASKKGALIRRAFAEELDIRCDMTRVNRLNKALIQTGSITRLKGFRFNQSTGIDRFFIEMPVYVNNSTLSIPSQVLPALEGITALEVKVMGARIGFLKHKVIATDAVRLVIRTGEEFPGAELSLDVPGDGVLMVTVQVRGFHNESPPGNRKHMAADIVAVVMPEPKEVTNNVVSPQYKRLAEVPSLMVFSTYEGCGQAFIQRE